MTDVFLDVLNASVAASWVVLAVLLARVILKKAPRWMVCALWAMVALRLFGPALPEAHFSLIPSSQIIPPQSLFDAAPVIDSGVAVIDNAINPVYTESLRPTPGASITPLQVWLAVFANIWGLGMIAMALWAFASCRRVRRQIRERIVLERNVYLCDRVDSPFIYGIFRPMICLPSSLGEDLRAYVIDHENAHIARRDHWWKPLGFTLLTINWFNPLMWLAYILLCRDIEIACDERVARTLDTDQKKAYSSALLECSIRNRHVSVCPLAFGEVGVRQRIKSILHYKKPAFWVILAAAVLITALAVGLLTNPVTKVSELRYDGNVYVLFNDDYSFLPVSDPIGNLVSILHNTTEHPHMEFQATNLDESLTGCPLYLEEDRIYLQKYDGTCMAFRLKSPEEFPAKELRAVLRKESWYVLNLHLAHLESNERLLGTAEETLKNLLRDVAKQNMTAAPSREWEQYALDCDIWLSASTVDDSQSSFSFFRTNEFGWVCMERSDSYGDYAWLFDGSALDSFLLPYTSELSGLAPTFPTEFDPWLFYETLEQKDTQLRIAIPGGDVGGSPNLWKWEPLESDGFFVGLRCRPFDRKSWMNIRYYPSDDPLYGCPPDAAVDFITLPSGVGGEICHTGDPRRWYRMTLETTQGHLYIDFVTETTDWTDDEYRMALSILSTLSVTREGAPVLGKAVTRQTFTHKNVTFTVDLPGGWLPEQFSGYNYMGFRFRKETEPEASVTVTYWPNRVTAYKYAGTIEEVTFPSGLVGEIYTPASYASWNSEPQWDFIYFWSTESSMYVEKSKDFAWDSQTLDEILEIAGTITITEDGIPLFRTPAYTTEGDDLGITLSVSSISPHGLTLTCKQDGTFWSEIITGSWWTVEELTESGWVSLMPESTAWTTEDYGIPLNGTYSRDIAWSLIIGTLDSGHYRVGKQFTGYRNPPATLGLNSEEFSQVIYAEFTIE